MAVKDGSKKMQSNKFVLLLTIKVTHFFVNKQVMDR